MTKRPIGERALEALLIIVATLALSGIGLILGTLAFALSAYLSK